MSSSSSSSNRNIMLSSSDGQQQPQRQRQQQHQEHRHEGRSRSDGGPNPNPLPESAPALPPLLHTNSPQLQPMAATTTTRPASSVMPAMPPGTGMQPQARYAAAVSAAAAVARRQQPQPNTNNNAAPNATVMPRAWPPQPTGGAGAGTGTSAAAGGAPAGAGSAEDSKASSNNNAPSSHIHPIYTNTSNSTNKGSNKAGEQQRPTRSALLQFLSTPDARNILAQAAAAAAAQLSKTPTASAAAAASAHVTANNKLLLKNRPIEPSNPTHSTMNTIHTPALAARAASGKRNETSNKMTKLGPQRQPQTLSNKFGFASTATAPTHPPAAPGNHHKTNIPINEPMAKVIPHRQPQPPSPTKFSTAASARAPAPGNYHNTNIPINEPKAKVIPQLQPQQPPPPPKFGGAAITTTNDTMHPTPAPDKPHRETYSLINEQMTKLVPQRQQHPPPTKVFALANNAPTPAASDTVVRPPPPAAAALGNHHRDTTNSIPINEQVIMNRQRMQQAYGMENPHIYEQLVQLLGKAEADRMVKEAVDETCDEENAAVVATAFSSSTSSAAYYGEREGGDAEKTVVAHHHHQFTGAAHHHRHLQATSTSTAAPAPEANNAETPSHHDHQAQDKIISIDDSENENRRSTGVTNNNNSKMPSSLRQPQPQQQHQQQSFGLHNKPRDDSPLINSFYVANPLSGNSRVLLPAPPNAEAVLAAAGRGAMELGRVVGMKRKFDSDVARAEVPPEHAPDTNTQTTAFPKTAATTTTVVAPPTSVVDAASQKRPKQIFCMDRDGKISRIMVGESHPLPTAPDNNGGGLETMMMTTTTTTRGVSVGGGMTAAAFANNIAAAGDPTTANRTQSPSPILSASRRHSSLSSAASASMSDPMQMATNPVAMPIIPQKSTITTAAAANTTPISLLDSYSQQDDPPGFDQFRNDPVLCSMILRSVHQLRYGNNLSMDNNSYGSGGCELKGGMFVHGLLNIPDDNLIVPTGGKPDLSVRQLAQTVLSPHFNIPPNLVASERHWEAYTHITSDMIYKIASNIVYERRKSMKCAVQLANYEIGSLRSKEKDIAIKDKRIQELEKELATVKEQHAQVMSEKAYQHFNQIRECEEGYAKFVESHRQEMKELKSEMETMRHVHTTFLESYAEASLDALRKARNPREKSRTPEQC